MRLFLLILILINVSYSGECLATKDADRSASFIHSNGDKIKVELIKSSLDSRDDLTILGFTVEKSSLSDVLNSFGGHLPKEEGDTSEYNSSICYLTSTGIGVRFNSGPMGGGSTITKIDVFQSEMLDKNDCHIIQSQKINNIENTRGISVGKTKNDIKKILGSPSLKASKNEWSYYYKSKKPSTKCEGGFDVMATYKFKFKKDKIIYFHITQTTSC